MIVQGETIGSSKNSWRIGKQIGSGACGSVHEIHSVNCNNDKKGVCNNKECSLYVVKVVELPIKRAAPKKKKSTQEIFAGLLSYEYMLYKGILGSLRGKYIPDVPLFGDKGDPYPAYAEMTKKGFSFLVMERMEAPINNVTDSLGGKETLGDVFVSMFECVRAAQNCGAVVVDIKLDNFMLARGSDNNLASRVRLIDFGLLKLCGQGGKHHEDMYPNAKMEGTPGYLSLNVMQGHTPSHRDDLEALGYIFMELVLSFVDETLPWSREQSDSKLREVKEQHMLKPNSKTSIFSLIDRLIDTSVSSVLKEYFAHVRSLQYSEKPNYEKLNRILAPLKLQTNSRKSGKKTSKLKSSGKRKQSLSDEDVSVLEVNNNTRANKKKNSSTKSTTNRKQITAKEEPPQESSDSDESSSAKIVTRRSARSNQVSSSSKHKSTATKTKLKKPIVIDEQPIDESDDEYFSANESDTPAPSQKVSSNVRARRATTKSTKQSTNNSHSEEKTMDESGTTRNNAINMKISIIDGPDQGKSFLVDKNPITIGRDASDDNNSNTNTKRSSRRHNKSNDNGSGSNTFFTFDDPEASSKHALLTLQQATNKSKHLYLRINDLYSTNGTYINNTQIKKGSSHKLENGDRFSLGRSTFLVSI